MKRNIKITVVTCLTALSAGLASAQTTPLASAGTRVAAIAHAARLSGEIALADRAGAVVDLAMGLSDRETQQPHRAGARWLWASVTKQVTAVLVMRQVEAGTLALDSTIRTYLPEFTGSTGDRVTLRHLLQHLSGLPDPNETPLNAEGVPGFYGETGAQTGDKARTLGYCAGTPKAAPGAGFAYNNCDYLVLGAILTRVTGKPYATLVAERIARPLRLKSLKLAPDGASRGGGVAIGYTTAGKRYPRINVATFGAAGALTGTARDLIALDRALVAGTLINPKSRALLWQGNPNLGYEALGVWSFPARLAGCATPVALIERRGDVGGIQVRNVIAPDLGRSIAVFTNDDTVDFGEVWQGKGLSYNLLSAAFCPAVSAASAQTNDHGAGQLNGDWTLDLRPTNDAPAYIKSMKLDITTAGIVRGDFYDHAIEDGRAFDAKGRVCFAFHTSDNTGPYQTSGCRVGDRIEGQSWSEGRHFLLTWTARRK